MRHKRILILFWIIQILRDAQNENLTGENRYDKTPLLRGAGGVLEYIRLCVI